jgi:hypothetical protein
MKLHDSTYTGGENVVDNDDLSLQWRADHVSSFSVLYEGSVSSSILGTSATHVLLFLSVVTVRLVLAMLFIQRLRCDRSQRNPLVRRSKQDIEIRNARVGEDRSERLSGTRDEGTRVQEPRVEKVGRFSAHTGCYHRRRACS